MQLRRWAPVGIAAACVLLVGCLEGSARTSDPSTAPASVAALTASVTSRAPAVSASTTITAPATVAKVPLTRTLHQGSKGDDVGRLQQRLIELKFDPGAVDGIYGPATTSAIWAYQSYGLGLTGRAVNGVVTPAMWDHLQDPITFPDPRPKATSTHFEVFLPQQTGLLFVQGQLHLITHVSTGSGKDYCATRTDGTPVCGKAITPGGIYRFNRRQSGWYEGDLGRMYNPVYFNFGIAVHGMTSVPKYPASHGCVRIPMHIAEYFPTLVHNGDQVFVFDGVKDPEAYGAQPPPFDHLDPSATTTTAAPSTTASSTTVPVATTKPTAQTTAPRPTTTAPRPTTTVPKPTTTVAKPAAPTTAAP